MQDQTATGIPLGAIRTTPPPVHCITNFAAMKIAAGASPAMVHTEKEAAEFAAISGKPDLAATVLIAAAIREARR